MFSCPTQSCKLPMTNSGEVLIDRADIERPEAEVRHLQEKVNGGGKRIEMRSDSGRIVIR